ncbi:hypothetical protein BI347_14785 [Chromobacterium sphagni]|uniref:Phosphoesterase n=1 Tax=Chromobacterium sphagni TaxID=1903179 RepID=A0A1S1X591_9NEIS|nr:alkaline phosphatase family protein [Chromobacterium sphagni]OHX14632.1 hypothetical protein BI347_14785 [Chromobacterium sphagni]
MVASTLPQVKNIVFLMLENRALDNVLGWLYSATSADMPSSAPQHVYPPGSSPLFDGLALGRDSNPAYTWRGDVQPYPVVPVPDNLGADQDRVPAYDPYEEMRANARWNGVFNQLFGNQDIIGGLPMECQAPTMQGFLQDYYAWYMRGWQGLDILWAYTPAQLPVINGLARGFAVSDRWFSSVPTQTNPNRAFSLCGTSLGRESNAFLAIEQFDTPTVFNYLAQAGKSWGLYYTSQWMGRSYTQYTFPQIAQAGGNSEIGNLATFFSRAQAGTLPDFTYLEPVWGYGKGEHYTQGTDYHPPTHVNPCEQFLQQVYQAVRSGPQWQDMLLIVTFDEHGGTYDHVTPPWGAINPDGRIGVDGFKFNLFGARVPTLLISPFVKPSTVFRAPAGSRYPFDHTSLIKTLLQWAQVDLSAVSMGRRMPEAPTFEAVLAREHVNEAPVAPLSLVPTLNAMLPAMPGGPLNALFEGVDFVAVKSLLAHAHMEDILAELARYRRDPRQFEDELIRAAASTTRR